MQSAIRWYGGKGHMATRLESLLSPHRIYVEPFGGGASLLHAKAPSPVEVYNDRDEGLVNFWRVMRTPELFERFCLAVQLTPYSRQEFREAKHSWAEQTDPVERAVRWYTVARQCVSGDHRVGGWSFCRGESTGGMSSSVYTWLAAVDRLPEIHERWRRVQIEHDDFRAVLERYDSPDTLFYCDPPYVPATREKRKNGRYTHEMTPEDHTDLVRLLLGIQGKCLLSGYDNTLYKPLVDAGWSRIEIATNANAAGRTRQHGILGEGTANEQRGRVEVVWISPDAVVQTSLF